MIAAVGTDIDIRRIDAPAGAEITGVDLSKPLDEEPFIRVRNAYFEHSVIVFRSQQLTPAQQIAFSRRFGELEIHVLKQFLLPGHPEILVVSNILDDGKTIGLADAGRVAVWHTDLSYMKAPSAGSALYALEIPRNETGEVVGDTLFASTFLAYDALSGEMQQRLARLQATHHMTKGYDRDADAPPTRIKYDDSQRSQTPDQAHPIIRTHPVTGRKCIYINKLCVTGIVGIPDTESAPLLEQIYAHCTRPEFIYRHQWSVGDLLMWDNCSLQHLAVPDYALPQRRRMHRTTIKGSRAFLAVALQPIANRSTTGAAADATRRQGSDRNGWGCRHRPCDCRNLHTGEGTRGGGRPGPGRGHCVGQSDRCRRRRRARGRG